MIRYTCPSCGSGLRVKSRLAGQDVKCPICQKVSTAPKISENLYSPTNENLKAEYKRSHETANKLQF